MAQNAVSSDTLAATPAITADSVATVEVPGPEGGVGVPQRWIYTSQVEPTLPAEDAWWQSFGDPALTKLIQIGERNNYNLSAALHRISMSRMLLKEATAGYFPTISLSAGWTAMQQSARTSSRFMETAETDYFSVGADMSWEIDLFGRVKAQQKVRKAQIKASRADYAGTQLSVAANIAKAYFTLRMYQEELATARAQNASQDHIYQIAETRKEVGLNSGLDVAQARQVVLTTEASIPNLEAMIETSINSLALLTLKNNWGRHIIGYVRNIRFFHLTRYSHPGHCVKII